MSGGISYGLPEATERQRAGPGRPSGSARIDPRKTRAPTVGETTGTGRRRRGRAAMALAAGASLLLVGVLLVGRSLLATRFPDVLGRWDRLWRQPIEQQVTGFAVLGLVVVALVYPLRRPFRISPQRTMGLRVVHAVMGLLALGAIVAHTNLRLGVNMNRLLSVAFLAFAVVGSLGAFSTGKRRTLGRVRRLAVAAHRLLFWPAVALIALHILAVYYF
jgi:nitrite reductase (NADH) large subunit